MMMQDTPWVGCVQRNFPEPPNFTDPNHLKRFHANRAAEAVELHRQRIGNRAGLEQMDLDGRLKSLEENAEQQDQKPASGFMYSDSQTCISIHAAGRHTADEFTVKSQSSNLRLQHALQLITPT
jgi:hypothetical protein